MIALNGANESLTAVLGGAVAVDWASSYETELSQGNVIGGANAGQQATTAAFTPVAAPSAGQIRRVKSVFATNVGASAVTIQFRKTVSGTARVLSPAMYMAVGDSVQFTPERGFQLLDSTGRLKTDALNAAIQSSIRTLIGGVRTAGLTAVKTLTNTTAFAYYIGKAPSSLSSVSVRARVTTALATITAAEVAIAKGAPVAFGSNPSLTVVGYADVSASYNSTGLKATTVNVSAGQTINPGDDLWVVFYGDATTAAILRAVDAADDIQTGVQAAATTSQPSVILGTPTTFTVEGATVLPPWFAVKV